ncbi:hypothetical protein FF2_008808 [Malus domestica]
MAHDRAMVHVVAPTSGAIKSDNGPAKPAKTGAHKKLGKGVDDDHASLVFMGSLSSPLAVKNQENPKGFSPQLSLLNLIASNKQSEDPGNTDTVLMAYVDFDTGWIIDFGATNHMTYDRTLFSSTTPPRDSIVTANGGVAQRVHQVQGHEHGKLKIVQLWHHRLGHASFDESNHDCPDGRDDHDRGNGPRPCDVCLSGPHVVPSENNDGSHADVTVCNPNYDDVTTVCLSTTASLSIPNRNCGVGPSEPSMMITPKFEQ